jgi:hypothetical protein
MKNKKYIKPEVIRIALDNMVSLQAGSQPPDPPPRTGGKKGGTDELFQSPFGDKPFS